MRVKFEQALADVSGAAYFPGETHEVPDDLGRKWIASGVAVAADQRPETATRSAPETAMMPKAKAGRR